MSALNILFYLMMGGIVLSLYAAYIRHRAIEQTIQDELHYASQSLRISSDRQYGNMEEMSAYFHNINASEEDDLLYRFVESGLHLVSSSSEETLDLIGGGLPRDFEMDVQNVNATQYSNRSVSA